MPAPPRTVALLLGLALAACGGSDDAACDDLGLTSQGLFGAQPEPSLVPLSDAEQLAVVVVVPGTQGDPGLCSGVLLDADLVLSAKHCAFGGDAAVRVGSLVDQSALRFTPTELIAHPTLDLLLLRLPAAARDKTGAAKPIAWSDTTLDDGWIGTQVQLAGAGRTETGSAGETRYLVEPIAELTETYIEVDGMGMRGACEGDSGGPMLVLGPDKAPRVIGVLSDGSRDCVSIDRYQRLGAAADWLEAELSGTHDVLKPPAKNACASDE